MFYSSAIFSFPMHLLLSQYHTVVIAIALQYSLKSKSVILPVSVFLLRIAGAIWGLLQLHTNFRIFFFYFCE